MHPHTATNPAARATTELGAEPRGLGLVADVRMLCQEVVALAHDQMQLAALETKLAGQSLVIMLAAGIMLGIALASAWTGLVVVVVAVLVHQGISIITALLLGVAANVLLALALGALIKQQSRHLLWSATLRSMRGASAEKSPSGAVP